MRTVLACVLAAASTAAADVATLNPVADAFVAASNPGSNYGGAGALCVASPGLSRGEFQTLMRFDTGPAFAAFNASLGAGAWVVQSVTLQLTATPASNPIFNAQASGPFGITWTQSDAWTEGTGMPNTPTTDGVTFSTLPSFESPGDQPAGTFTSPAATSGTATYTLNVTSGLNSDIINGSVASLRFWATDATTSYTFNSRNFMTMASRPVLTITAAPRPCGSADFNGDGDIGTDADIEAFFACLGGDCCASCGSADFNNDGDVGTDADIESFFRVLGGGPC